MRNIIVLSLTLAACATTAQVRATAAPPETTAAPAADRGATSPRPPPRPPPPSVTDLATAQKAHAEFCAANPTDPFCEGSREFCEGTVYANFAPCLCRGVVGAEEDWARFKAEFNSETGKFRQDRDQVIFAACVRDGQYDLAITDPQSPEQLAKLVAQHRLDLRLASKRAFKAVVKYDDDLGAAGLPLQPDPEPSPPLYKRWWFWGLVGAGVAAGVVGGLWAAGAFGGVEPVVISTAPAALLVP